MKQFQCSHITDKLSDYFVRGDRIALPMKINATWISILYVISQVITKIKLGNAKIYIMVKFSVAKATLQSQMSVRLSESETPNQLEINHHSSSFIILHHPSSSFLHFATFKLFSLLYEILFIHPFETEKAVRIFYLFKT